MKTRSLVEMERLLDLKFQQKQRVFSKVLAEENRLRAHLMKLDTQAREADSADIHHIRAIGADVIWKAWVGRTKTNLNLELAQVLAQKERLKSTVNREYGKLLVGRELLDHQQKSDLKGARRRTLDAAIESHFHRKSNDPRK